MRRQPAATGAAEPPAATRQPVTHIPHIPHIPHVAGVDAARRESPASTPPAGVLETLRAIEANAAQWTALAGSSLARRGVPATSRPSAAADAPAVPAADAEAGSRTPADVARPPAAMQLSAPAPTTDAVEPPQRMPEDGASPAAEMQATDRTTESGIGAKPAAPLPHETADASAAPVSSDALARPADEANAAPDIGAYRSPLAGGEEPPAWSANGASLSPVEPGAHAPSPPWAVAAPVAPAGREMANAKAAAPASPEAAAPSEPEATAEPDAIDAVAAAARAATATATAIESAPAEPAPRRPLQGHTGAEFTFHAPAASSVELPALDLLEPASTETEEIPAEHLAQTGQLIEQRLQEFKVPVTVVGASAGPVITRFEIEPALGVRGSQIVGLMKDLSRGLGLTSIRVVETIPGKTCMGLELPNAKRHTIRLSEILAAQAYRHSASKLTLAMGKDITGHPIVTDLAKAPHMLVAGTTGSGKSVAINAMIVSLLFKATPEEVRLIMIDPKMLELSVYEGIPHLLAPVVTDMKLAANALNWCVGEMEKRYRLMSAVGVRNLAGFNQKLRDAQAAGKKIGNPFSLTPEAPEPLSPLPLIVVVIDELADLMMVAGKKIEELIARLAQKARAAGIHLILATQRPSVDVITGLIKANIPTRVAFQVSSKIDSRTILDQMGAESLLGQGDMLFLPPGTGYPQRVHGAFVADEEVHRVVEHLKQFGEPEYEEGILDGPASEGAAQDLFGDAPDAEADPLYDEAVAFVVRTRRASISAVQRQLRIGYNRAARLVEQMEAAGLVSSMSVNGSREVLAPPSSDA